jgi:P-type E1-E2 ATPase
MSKCRLCEAPCYLENEAYCCLGCETVHQILQRKGIKCAQEDPLFLHAQQQGWLKPSKGQSCEKERAKGERYIRQIEGMWCSSCALAIQWLLEEVPGVIFASVDYASDLLVLRLDPLKVGMRQIEEKLKSWGYTLKDPLKNERQNISDFFTWKIAVMAFLGMNTMMLSYPAYIAYLGVETQGYEQVCSVLSGLMSIPLLWLALWPLSKSAWLSLRAGLVGFECLIVLASFSSLLLSFWRLFQGNPHVYFDTAWVLLGLQFLGKGLEKSFKLKARETVLATLDRVQSKIRVPSAEGWGFKSAKDLKIGELIGVLAGDMLRVEAEIETGTVWVDLSWERGEAQPACLGAGQLLHSGMMVVSGSAQAKVKTLVVESELETWLNQLAGALEQRRKKQESEFKISRLIAVLTILVFFLAMFIALWALAHHSSGQEAFERAMSVLIISCPCSLGIAIPLARARLFSRASQLGFWVRRPQALETAGQIDTWVLDKTGTLTEGQMRLISAPLSDPFSLKCLKALSLHSNHPLCLCLQEALKNISCEQVRLDHVQETYGVGLKGYIEGKEIYLGRPSEYKELHISCEFKIDKHIVATLLFEDTLRPQAKTLVQALKNPVLLSGDHLKRCQITAHEVGISHVYGEKTSFEKASWIQQWKKDHPFQKIALVGDGLNDALAMQESDFSIAMASGRSDPTSALHWSDVALVKEDLVSILELISYSKRTKIVSLQNLFLGFFYNLIFIPLAFSGALSPIHAAIAMMLNSISILVNSCRI